MNYLNYRTPEYDFTGRCTPSEEAQDKEAQAFIAYRAKEDAKKFKVRDAFGFSRYSTLEEAQAFAATLKNAEILILD
jgi:hypothetical protein